MIIGDYHEDAWLHHVMEVQRLLEKSQACLAELGGALRELQEPIGKCMEEDPNFLSRDALQRLMEIRDVMEKPERVIQEMKMQAEEAAQRYRAVTARFAEIDQELANLLR